jgi:Dual-action HEIGH metallo-peptidase
MGRAHLLLMLVLFLCASGETRGQGVGVAWTKVPSVIIVGQAGDARAPLVHAAVAHWNSVLAAIGSAFRLGPVTQRSSGGAAEPGNIVVVLSDGVFVSHDGRSSDGQRAVVMIRNDRVPPLSLPNVARNVIAHELGHAIGLRHNSDPAMLMCGRPSPCRPDVFASSTPRYFPLSSADRANLLAMYPASWKDR